MKFRFTIGTKIGTSFFALIFLTIIAFILTTRIVDVNKDKTEQVIQQHAPSVSLLKELKSLLDRSQNLISKWYYVQTSNDTEDKNELRKIIDSDYSDLKTDIKAKSKNWDQEDKNTLNTIFSLVDEQFLSYKTDIMSRLSSWKSYEDPNVKFNVTFPFEESIESSKIIYEQLSILVEKQQMKASEVSDEMLHSFTFLQNLVKGIGIILVLGGIIIATFTVKSIVSPILKLKKILQSMGKGVIPNEKIQKRNDEIGEMSLALEHLKMGLQRTTVFANEVGSGNFQSRYTPLSEADTLGLALLKMREDLAENERVLEAKVIERTEEVVLQKEEIEIKNKKLEVLYKQVTDSILYAKRIQLAILPPEDQVKRLLPDSFVFYKPKDIVSGDFYWLHEKNNKVLFAAVDCTGHGVPGAFMSIVGYNQLKHIMLDTHFTQPAAILEELNIGVSETLHQGQHDPYAKDGMDISLCSLDYKTLELEFSGAYNPLYMIRNGQLSEIAGNRFPIGFFAGRHDKKFTNHKLQLQKGDCLYLFSDGFADQFGGAAGKKFMISRFRELLTRIHKNSMEDQKNLLNDDFDEWKGGHEQVDDILVMGIRI